jgi:orotate phosphoribosyltransferase
MFEFNASIVRDTHDLVGAYKLNLGFYLAWLEEGITALRQTIEFIKKTAPDVPIILDCKDCDIGNTNNQYLEMILKLGVHAITAPPYLGEGEALDVFLKEEGLGVIILCRTSNPGATMFQNVRAQKEAWELEYIHTSFDLEQTAVELGWSHPMHPHYLIPLYQLVAMQAATWNHMYGDVGIVVGATYPEDICKIGKLIGNTQMLIPGVGKQGGAAAECAFHAADDEGIGFLINSSRDIIFNPNPRLMTMELNRQINEGRAKQMLKRTNAVITDDHFVYASGKHGDTYINKDAVFVDPIATETILTSIALKLADNNQFDFLVGPEVGGAKMLHGIAMALYRHTGRKVQTIHADKDGDIFKIRRGYENLLPGKRAIVVEDIINTGGSVSKVIDAIIEVGGACEGVVGMVNRGGATAESLAANWLYTVYSTDLQMQEAEACSLCAQDRPINTKVGHGKKFLEEHPNYRSEVDASVLVHG